MTAFSASSIGIFIVKIFKREIPSPVSLIMMGIPIALTFVNLISPGQPHSAEKLINDDEHVNYKVINSFTRICNLINQSLEAEWKELNKNIQF